MSASEFPFGVSAISEGHFGGGQSYFADRRHMAVNPDGRSGHPPAHQEDQEPHDDESAEQNLPTTDDPATKVAQLDEEIEPTYDLSKTAAEHHAHLGRLLDVKL